MSKRMRVFFPKLNGEINMAKRITQETFNDVVKENMEEFDMDEKEAVADAVKQFESQGVDLSSIVKAFTTSLVHPVIKALTSLQELHKPVKLDQVQPHYEVLLEYLNSTDAATASSAREMAGRNDGTFILLDLLHSSYDHAIQIQTMNVLKEIVNGNKDNQDFVGANGISQLMAFLQPNATVHPVQNAALAALKTTCAKHESNKKHLTTNGVKPLIELFAQHHKSFDTSQIAELIRVLTINDDPLAMFSQAHDTIKLFVDLQLVSMTVDHIKTVSTGAATVAIWFAVLKQLAVTEDHCRKIVDCGALDLVLEMQKAHPNHRGVIKHSLGLLRNIAGVDEYKQSVTAMVPSILTSMQVHEKDGGIQSIACATIAAVCLRAPNNCTQVVNWHAHMYVAKAMSNFLATPTVLRQASLAIRNMVVRNEELRQLVLEERQVEAMLRHAMPLRGCGDEAYAALRDLGCDIPLAAITKAGSANFNPTMATSNTLTQSISSNARAPFKA
ncbi:hypothetical protein THRCLA_08420 [Thraustotheca clavata]|uniref:Uncharacterized protein n=1 Tax=Thraustotheca clavata TaxID=74557 RepID=A0A1V9Z6L3_9STRA|nr:hypothetical protein THRCLA_08420 [Thraustotheca clavata]